MEANKEEYSVYRHTNKINNKVYVGITKQKINKRWNYGRGYKGSSYFYSAIQKYGWDNFEHKVLIHGLTKEQAEAWEKKLIKVWELTNPRNGYNLNSGGNAGSLSRQSRLKVSQNNSRYYLGKNLKKETIDKIKENSKKKAVLCVETGIIYESIHEAGRTLNICIPHISTVCKGNTSRKIAGGYHWKYVYEEQKLTPDYVNVKKKKIMCVETKEIFNSIMEASRVKNIERTTISNCINSRNDVLTAGGFHWVVID